MPGGFGTLDELFESLTLIQTHKIGRFPIVLVGKDFWGGLIDWIEKTVRDKYFNISPDDMKLIKVVDNADDAVGVIEDFYNTYMLKPNF
jgi:predicted Rossmann-fold nucleotide-binding protein